MEELERLKKEIEDLLADYQDLGKEFSKLQDKLDYKDYCLDNIIGLGFDYEGCEVEGCKPVDYLKELIDELVEEARKGLACDENDEEMKEVLKWIHEGKHSEGYLENQININKQKFICMQETAKTNNLLGELLKKAADEEGDHIPRID